MDDDEDFGSDIEDAEFIAIATQAEQQFLSSASNRPPSQTTANNNLPDGFNIDNDIDFEETGFSSFSQAPPRGNMRQATLFGSSQVARSGAPQSSQHARRNWPLANSHSQEKSTHHKIDLEAAKTWVYPINVSYRDYQFNIVRRALLSNVLCALPTGLGKTFIAAAVMLNWFRWAPEGQIAFLAPTKPLVHQQIEACFNIAGIPRSQTATMTGGVQKALRQEYWEERRVFFTTPQTMQNDIKNGLCDPKRIVCLVVDEAHRTTGAYAYGEVVKLVRRENNSFRLLALTATPGSTVESVQGVIDALGISRIEIRTDESIDIRQYIQRRHLEVRIFPSSDEMNELRDLYCKCLEPMLKRLNNAKAFYQTRAENLTPFATISQMQQWMNSPLARNLNKGYYWGLVKIFKNLASLAHALVLLNTHGIRLFYEKLLNARDDAGENEVDKSALNSIRSEPSYNELMDRAAVIVAEPNFSGHPKVDFMVNAILKHFAEAEDEDTKRSTRIMVFTSFRDSAEEVTRLLKRHEPLIRPHVFVGQAAGKNSAGMSQKEQLEIIKRFSEGTYNTIVSTSIGEEGLDIGEVDLIVCYDTSASPIRLLQRMGRTGRKRVGSVLILLAEGREQESYKKALDNYAVMQRKIASGSDFTFQHDLSPRIIPKHIDPQPVKKHIDIPIENTQAEPEKKRRVGTILSTDSSGGESDDDRPKDDPEPLAPVIDADSNIGLLTEEEERILERDYKQVNTSDQTTLMIEPPELHRFPEVQRSLTKTGHVGHGDYTKRVVEMLKKIHEVDDKAVERLKRNYDPEFLKSLKKESPKKKNTMMAFKPVRPATARPKPAARKPTASLKEKTANRPAPDEGEEKEITRTTKPKPQPQSKRKGTGMFKKRPIATASPEAPKKRKIEVEVSSDSDSEGSLRSSDSELLPDAKDLVMMSGFRWAGKRGRVVGRSRMEMERKGP
ncbi:P-loop containing nucleoside triphosphate hydrolase protein [Trichophaea hybrida]|nr:P-loop containing nucleoside triphosphate hydrolase protein [Trichophaea hybrida]